jgi:hypothetical protein
MSTLRSAPPTGNRTKRGSPTLFVLQTRTGIDICSYQSRERAMSAARWVALRSGEHVDVTCERTGQVWGVSGAQEPSA